MQHAASPRGRTKASAPPLHCFEVPLDVIIDGRALVGQRTGIGVHTAEIARRFDFAPAPLIATHTEIDDKSGLEHCRFRVDHALNGVLWQQLRLPRIGGDAALYFDPNDARELESLLRRVVNDAALRAELGARGRKRAAEFRWERAADETLAVLRKAGDR